MEIQKLIQLGMDNLPFGIFFVDENNTMRACNRFVKELFDYPDECIGMDLYECHSEKSYSKIDELLEALRKGETREKTVTENGKNYTLKYFPVFDKSGTYRGFVEISEEMKENN